MAMMVHTLAVAISLECSAAPTVSRIINVLTDRAVCRFGRPCNGLCRNCVRQQTLRNSESPLRWNTTVAANQILRTPMAVWQQSRSWTLHTDHSGPDRASLLHIRSIHSIGSRFRHRAARAGFGSTHYGASFRCSEGEDHAVPDITTGLKDRLEQ